MWQLFQFPLCPFSRKVRLVLGEKGIAHDLVRENPWERRDEFVDLNPAGETPVMVDADAGTVLIGSQPIVEYFDETVDKMPMIHGNAVLRAEIRRLVEWFDEKLYREAVEPLMNERMRKRLVSQQSPGHPRASRRDAHRQRPPRLCRLSARPPALAGGAGPQPRRLHRGRAFERDRLSGRARLARAQADQGLVFGDEVAPLLPAAARRADGGDRPARPLRQGRLLTRAKRLALAAALVVLALIAVLEFNALRLDREPLADVPAPPQLDAAAVERLSQALRIATVSTDAAPPSAESLGAFHALLARSFPRVHAELRRENVGGSLLFTWPGSDPAEPAMLLAAHQDVVPVEAGSGGQWAAPPFSGAVTRGFVHGRGAIDDKGSLMAILEAAERLLARGHRPRQTIYLAFGHDEERGGTGAAAMAALLKRRGANIGLALDEGYAVLDGVIAGINAPIAMIGIAEKGYVSVELSATGPGGHSSLPTTGNPAVRIARAVTRINREPMPARLGGPTAGMLDGIAPYADLPMRVALANRWLAAPLVERNLLASPDTAAAIRTTSATTILRAGTKDNVLPQQATAVINHRILPGDSIRSVLAHDRRATDDRKVRMRALPGGREPSRPAATDSAEYRRLRSVIRASFPHAAVALRAGARRHRRPSL